MKTHTQLTLSDFCNRHTNAIRSRDAHGRVAVLVNGLHHLTCEELCSLSDMYVSHYTGPQSRLWAVLVPRDQ